MARTRIWCGKHKRWHSAHAAYHCQKGTCPPGRMDRLVVMNKGERMDIRAPQCPVDIHEAR